MRVAALHDTHANLPAPEAVLREVRDAEVDHVPVGGDAVLGQARSAAAINCRQISRPVVTLPGQPPTAPA